MPKDERRPVESFARLYDDILENPKIAVLPPASFGLYCAMIVYCHRNDTDGVIPVSRARGLLDFSSGYPLALTHLQARGLVTNAGPGNLEIHDYLLHNTSHAERIAKRTAASTAARIRWGNAEGNAESMPRNKEKVKEKGLENKESKSTLETENDLSPEGDLALSTDPSSDPVNMVFERWKQSTHKNGKTVLTAGRRRIIRAACKDYPLADVLDAVEGWEFIPHNRGENDRHREFNDIELLLRDAKHIETFRDAKRGNVVTTGKVHHLDAWAGELLGEGDRG